MLCEHCQKRIASVHFTQVVNNSKNEMYLCEQCAKEKGQFSFGSPMNINDFLTGLMGLNHTAPYRASVPQQILCDKCSMSFEEFQKTGKLGCNNCYVVFGEKLKPLFKRLHGSAEHHGKVPAKLCACVQATKEIDKLKELLDKAIQGEEYEKAAEIRDRIKSLEGGAC